MKYECVAKSGQVASYLFAVLAVAFSYLLFLHDIARKINCGKRSSVCLPLVAYVMFLGCPIYYGSRYFSDIGVRGRVVKLKVEELLSFQPLKDLIVTTVPDEDLIIVSPASYEPNKANNVDQVRLDILLLFPILAIWITFYLCLLSLKNLIQSN